MTIVNCEMGDCIYNKEDQCSKTEIDLISEISEDNDYVPVCLDYAI